ncbi:hypothetical protein C3747_564g9 [Trypanosoma cruzi]|uniref:Uncharacterized protein n=1 Tax=Trypanosoma cruzi TaxID=5693 RepID=A0A2V2UP90_TRYCR|nr:hypothetical protein C3747_564g9 [Trypanosoma cruzi]
MVTPRWHGCTSGHLLRPCPSPWSCSPHFQDGQKGGRRVRQRLLDCATRCRPPTEGPLIEVSVADDTAAIARRVWAELSAIGLTDIPEIQTLDMAAALGRGERLRVFSVPFPPPRGVCCNSDCVTREGSRACAARDAGRQEGAEGLPCDDAVPGS